jgi:hypothetical protein
MKMIKWIKKIIKEHKANVIYCRELDNNYEVKVMMNNLYEQGL